jgi:hypothetical protein
MERYWICNIERVTPNRWRFRELNSGTDLFRDLYCHTLKEAVNRCAALNADTVVTCVY